MVSVTLVISLAARPRSPTRAEASRTRITALLETDFAFSVFRAILSMVAESWLAAAAIAPTLLVVFRTAAVTAVMAVPVSAAASPTRSEVERVCSAPVVIRPASWWRLPEAVLRTFVFAVVSFIMVWSLSRNWLNQRARSPTSPPERVWMRRERSPSPWAISFRLATTPRIGPVISRVKRRDMATPIITERSVAIIMFFLAASPLSFASSTAVLESFAMRLSSPSVSSMSFIPSALSFSIWGPMPSASPFDSSIRAWWTCFPYSACRPPMSPSCARIAR